MRDPADFGVEPVLPEDGLTARGVADEPCGIENVTANVRQLNQAAASQIERAERTLRLIHTGDDEPSVVAHTTRAPLQFVPVAAESTGRSARRWLTPIAAFGALTAVAGVALALQMPNALVSRHGSSDVRVQTVAPAANVMPDLGAQPIALSVVAPALPDGEVGSSDIGASLYTAHFKSATGIEHQCLARAIYYEARGEPYEGQVAVAQVIVNRVRSQRWPDSICGVVHQGEARGEKCQFSFVCQRALAETSGPQWDEAQALATEVLAGRAWLREAVEATHYHTTKVAPVWRQELVAIATIGNHIFYRELSGLRLGTKAYAPESAPAALAAAARQAEAEKTAARNERAKAVSAKAKVAETSSASAVVGRSEGDWKLNAFGN
jgi:Cell Wall Hydrolase